MSNVADKEEKLPQQESYWDRHGVPRVTIEEATWNIELSIKSNQTRGCICLISEAGEGKSQLIHQIARKYGRRVCDIRTAQFSLIGAGVPQRADEKTGMFKIAVPSDFPQPGEKALFVCDEFNQGAAHAISMIFKLLEDRGIYDYKLPDDCLVILAMNPSTAAYQVSKIETNPAITRRLKKFYVYTPYVQWKHYAQTNEFHRSDGLEKPCHPAIMRFLDTEPNRLYTTKDRDAHKAFACPATYQTASLDLYNMEAAGEPITSERAENRLAASLNTVNARAIIEYVRNNEARIAPTDVLFKYKAKSKLRERIKKLADEPGGEYPKLLEGVASHMFDTKPSAEEIAPQLVLFWSDMPAELSQAFYQMLAAASEAGGPESTKANIDYMKVLTEALQTEPLWDQINKKVNEAHDSFEKSLKVTEPTESVT